MKRVYTLGFLSAVLIFAVLSCFHRVADPGPGTYIVFHNMTGFTVKVGVVQNGRVLYLTNPIPIGQSERVRVDGGPRSRVNLVGKHSYFAAYLSGGLVLGPNPKVFVTPIRPEEFMTIRVNVVYPVGGSYQRPLDTNAASATSTQEGRMNLWSWMNFSYASVTDYPTKPLMRLQSQPGTHMAQ